MASRDLAKEPGLLLAQLVDFGAYDGEFSDQVVAEVQRRLRKHDDALLCEIIRSLTDTGDYEDYMYGPDGKALVIEALAGARVPEYADLVECEIYLALESPEEHLRFSAVAAISDLPYTHKSRAAKFVRQNRNSIEGKSMELGRAIVALLDSREEES